MQLVVATSNAGKLREIRAILADAPVTLLSLSDFPSIPPPAEHGHTFAENAREKALAYAAATHAIVVAEDSGLEIDELDGAPGVHSARFGGENATYPERFALIYKALRARGRDTSPARFVCALALARPGDVMFETAGTIDGRIAGEPAGSGGFGYDPIFFYPPFGCTLAEAGDRKSEVSHRGAAFRKLREFLSRTSHGQGG